MCYKSVPIQNDPIDEKLVALPNMIHKPENVAEIMNSCKNSIIRRYLRDHEAALLPSTSTFHNSKTACTFDTSYKNCIASSAIGEISSKQSGILDSLGRSSSWPRSLSEDYPFNRFIFSPIADPFSDCESFDSTYDAISTNSKTSALLNTLIAVPPNADQRLVSAFFKIFLPYSF